MLNRCRLFLAAAALAALLGTGRDAAADWRKEYPTINFAVISGESQVDVLARYVDFEAYLERTLGVDANIVTATDYAGIIEALRTKRAHASFMGPAGYARAWIVSGGDVEAFAVMSDHSGITHYNSVMVVRADSPAQSVEDMKGKTVGYSDPNSTSGFQSPTYYLRRQGIVPNEHFGHTSFAGNHENALLGVLNGTYDATFTSIREGGRSTFGRMQEKGMIPKDSVRIIWKSPNLPDDPFVMVKSLPEDMKAAIKDAMVNMAERDPKALESMSGGSAEKVLPATHDFYADIVEMLKENERMRRGG